MICINPPVDSQPNEQGMYQATDVIFSYSIGQLTRLVAL